MTNQEIRNGFNQMIAVVDDPDAIAKLEVLREYYSNPKFKKNLEDHLWEMTQQSNR